MTGVHNAAFWRSYFQNKFVGHLDRLLDVMEKRLLPAFDNISAEADEVARLAYEVGGNSPWSENDDGGALAEDAFNAGLDHYSGMSDVRQSLINVFAVMLYHAWEQQVLSFHRREILGLREQHDHALYKLSIVATRLKQVGVDMASLPSWGKLQELGLIANTAKHADGQSAQRLKAARPELFVPPSLRDGSEQEPAWISPRVEAPLSGDDLYLTWDDLKQYGAAAITFWTELHDALLNAPSAD